MNEYFIDVPEGFSVEKDSPSVCSECYSIVPIWGQDNHTAWHLGVDS